MKLILAALALAGCAEAPHTPYDFAAVEAHQRVNFKFKGNWHAVDYVAVPEGQTRWGNCTTFSATAVAILKQHGVTAFNASCHSKYGPHSFALIPSKGLVVDDMHMTAVPFREMECQ